MPTFTFMEDHYTIGEKDGALNVIIHRLGDLTVNASVICHTRQNSAFVMHDYVERPNSNRSIIIFQPGERVIKVYHFYFNY